MPARASEGSVRRHPPGPEVVAPTKRVNIALPFSHQHVDETSNDVAELAGIVADLAAAHEEIAPGPKVKRLRERAQAFRARLH